MPALDIQIVREADGPPWGDLAERVLVLLPDAYLMVAVIEGGMKSGAPSVALRIDLSDEEIAGAFGVDAATGFTVIAETSLGSLMALLAAARGAFPEAFEGGPFAAP